MKKVLLTLACVFGMSTAASALTSSAVLLQHNGNITTYAAEDIGSAMAAAADGDEVFLNEGKYPGFTISKAIKIKGAGQTTVIDGSITIDNSGDTSIGDIFIGFMKINNDIIGKSSVNKLNLLQCNFRYYKQEGGVIDEVFVDRCETSCLYLDATYKETVTIGDVTTTTTYPRTKKFTAINSKISVSQGVSVYSAYPPYTIVNCYVSFTYNNYGLTVINSITENSGNIYYSELINCSYRTLYGNTNKLTGCYQSDTYGSDIVGWSIYKLEDNNFFGNDGTVIGPLGGTRNTPFTLVPVVPRVTESTLKVDPTNKKLDVTVTVSPK